MESNKPGRQKIWEVKKEETEQKHFVNRTWLFVKTGDKTAIIATSPLYFSIIHFWGYDSRNESVPVEIPLLSTGCSYRQRIILVISPKSHKHQSHPV